MAVVAHTLTVPGAQLHYEVRGAGPLLLLSGATTSTTYDRLADFLATGYQVVTYDLRGIGRSVRDDPSQDISVEVQASDLHRLLARLTSAPASIFANSSGAIVALDMMIRHPEQVRTIIAHEPPLLDLLPDRDRLRAQIENVYQTYRDRGPAAAWPQFLAHSGMDQDAEDGSKEPHGAADCERPGPSPNDSDTFLGHMLRPTTGYRPDIAALRQWSSKIVVAAGTASVGQLAHRTALALAETLATDSVTVPGGHLGFVDHPAAFATILRRILCERT